MTIALLVALVAINIAYLIVNDRRDKRSFEERRSEREVMNRLLQRIQAPEQAVVDYAPHQPSDGPLFSNEWAAEQERLEELFAEDGDR